MDLQALINRVGVGRFELACEWAWRTAVGTGNSGQQLVADARWHRSIFRSLLFSAFDVYGSIEPVAARDLLTRLDLPETKHLALLREKLA